MNSHPFSSLLGTLQRKPCGSRRSDLVIPRLPCTANRTSSKLNIITRADTRGLGQYPTIISFNLPLSYPPGLTDFGNRYASKCFVDQKRLALTDIRLFRGKLYGNGNEWNVSICFFGMCIRPGDTTSPIVAHGE